jgi:hypothetical protein
VTKVFFATDIHGSDICWKKFIHAGKFYGADVLILGGDMTGKAIVPIVHLGRDHYRASLLEQAFELSGEDEVQEFEKRVRSRGYYPYRTSPEEITELTQAPEKVDELFQIEVMRTLEQWMDFADRMLKDSGIRCYVCPGNDDLLQVDEIIRASNCVHLAEGRVIDLDRHHQMISSGWSNITPWRTFREESEDALRARYAAMIAEVRDPGASIFNIHVPPYGSMLDDAPELDENLRPKYAGNAVRPVGSHALREAIEKHQPLLGLHGHIHESRGAIRIGRTLCINPGSIYEQGSLLGALIQLGRNKIETYVLTSG